MIGAVPDQLSSLLEDGAFENKTKDKPRVDYDSYEFRFDRFSRKKKVIKLVIKLLNDLVVECYLVSSVLLLRHGPRLWGEPHSRDWPRF